MDAKLFVDVKFVLGKCNNLDQLKETLQENGATLIHYLSEIVTHVISDVSCLEAEQGVGIYDAIVVTSPWVYLSLRSKKQLPPNSFSPFNNYLLNATVAFSMCIEHEDAKKLAAMVTFHGGKVTKHQTDASHLIVSKVNNDLSISTGSLKLVTPDWVLNSIKQKTKCNELLYDPQLLEYPPPKDPTPEPTDMIEDKLNSATSEQKQAQPQFDTATYPFANCSFKFVEYDDVDTKIKESWFSGIKLAGGIFQEDLLCTTHLICETRFTPVYDDAIKFGVRCVTIHWINDVIAERDLRPPWKALHLPVAFPKGQKTLAGQIITSTNFKGKEKTDIKQMIIKTGATYTGYMSFHNTLLVCRHVGGAKYEKAIQWKVPVVNCQFLNDILLNQSADIYNMLKQSKYQLFDNDPLKLMSHSSELFDAWKRPIKYPYRKQLPSVEKFVSSQNGNHSEKKTDINALLKKDCQHIFKNIVFFITPSVLPSATVVSTMIEKAGGLVARKKLPSRLQIEQIEAKGDKFLIVSCNGDKHLLAGLDATVVTADFVLSGISSQELPKIEDFTIK